MAAALGRRAVRAGESVRLVETVTEEAVEAYARLSGDCNPLHMDEGFARGTGMGKRVAHGMIAGGYVSRLIGMQLPGPGALWTEQSFRWLAPIFIGDTVEVSLTVTSVSPGTKTLGIRARAVNQNGRTVMEGKGIVRVLERQCAEPDTPLPERSALITGGSRGIGAAIAKALGAAGARITVLSRTVSSDALEVCRIVNCSGGQAIAVEGDVRNPDEIQAAMVQSQAAFGRPVDVLVNNAGSLYEPAPFEEMKWSMIQQQLDVQVRGAFHCCQSVLPGMIAAGSGRIVNIGSTYAWGVPPVRWTGFAIAKAALKTLTQSLAAELGSKGIRVNMVSPGLTETEFGASVPDRLRRVQAMQTPLRRLATPEDIGAAVVFLCSSQGAFITGADIPVCGGSVM